MQALADGVLDGQVYLAALNGVAAQLSEFSLNRRAASTQLQPSKRA